MSHDKDALVQQQLGLYVALVQAARGVRDRRLKIRHSELTQLDCESLDNLIDVLDRIEAIGAEIDTLLTPDERAEARAMLDKVMATTAPG